METFSQEISNSLSGATSRGWSTVQMPISALSASSTSTKLRLVRACSACLEWYRRKHRERLGVLCKPIDGDNPNPAQTGLSRTMGFLKCKKGDPAGHCGYTAPDTGRRAARLLRCARNDRLMHVPVSPEGTPFRPQSSVGSEAPKKKRSAKRFRNASFSILVAQDKEMGTRSVY